MLSMFFPGAPASSTTDLRLVPVLDVIQIHFVHASLGTFLASYNCIAVLRPNTKEKNQGKVQKSLIDLVWHF